MRLVVVVVVALLPLFSAGCARLERCGAGASARVIDTLYFGTARPGGVVTNDQWRDFLAQSVTPRFPDGLTAWGADGQWRGASGTIEREASHVLQIVHERDPESAAALDALVADYRRRFEQEAVMRVTTHACVGFGSE